MDERPTGTAPRTQRWLVPGLCALVLLGLRWPSYHEPPERDIATYAVIGRELNLGRTLYDDLWDHKPPPVYWVYSTAHRLAGEGPLELLIIWFAGAFACVTGVRRAARRLGGEEAGTWAALLLTLTSADLFLQANEANTELLVNATLAWGVALLPGLEGSDEHAPLTAAASGLLLGLAVLTKPVALFPAAGICLAFALLRVRRLRARALPELGLGALAAVLPGGLTLAYFALTSRWRPFTEAVVTYNSWYASDIWSNFLHGLQPGMVLPRAAATLWLLVPSAGLAFLARRRSASWWIGWVWLAATPLAVAAPGRFYPHYYQLWLPPLALMGGLGIASLPAPTRMRRWLGTALVALLLVSQAPSLVLSARQWSSLKYGNIFVEAERTARTVGGLVPEGSWIFVWGDEPEIYWLSHTRPASGVLWAKHMTEGPLAQPLTERTLEALERHPPALVVLARHAATAAVERHPVFRRVVEQSRAAPPAWQNPQFEIRLPRTNG